MVFFNPSAAGNFQVCCCFKKTSQVISENKYTNSDSQGKSWKLLILLRYILF